MSQVPLTHVVILSTALFFIGMYGLFTRRNLVTMLMSVELILNSANINFVAFNRYLYPEKLDGVFFTLFIIAIAAAEAAAAKVAKELAGLPPSEILVCSTGVIGAPLRVEKILKAVPELTFTMLPPPCSRIVGITACMATIGPSTLR